jgi:hypothetical protein
MNRRLKFCIVGICSAALLVLWLRYRDWLFNYNPWVSHAAWISMLALFVLGLMILQNDAAEELKDQVTEFGVGVFMAIAISIILVGEEDQNFLEKEELIKTATIAFVIFAVTTIGRSGRSLKQSANMLETVNLKFEEFKKGLDSLSLGVSQQRELYANNVNLLKENKEISAESKGASSVLKEATSEALRAIGEAQFGGLAARALGLKHADLLKKDRGELDTGIVIAADPGLGALRAWIQVGKELVNDKARGAWWQVMSVYHQEEIYDISSKEVATNVRSYAYILLAVVSRLLRSLDDGEKLVMVNVSAFAPKDFYNFPNGQREGRFYHEAEFFGIYRRLLAAIAMDKRVVPYRVVFADPAIRLSNAETHRHEGNLHHSSPHLEASEAGSQLGWQPDPFWKLVLDCARLHIISWPVVGPRLSIEGEDFVPPERRTDWGAAFPKNRDPAKRLPYSTTRFLWAPTYADVHNVLRTDSHIKIDARKDWLERVWLYENPFIHSTYRTNLEFSEFEEKGYKNAEVQFQTRIEAMRTRCQEFCGFYIDNQSDRANLQGRLDGAWTHIIDDLVSWLPLGDAEKQAAKSCFARIVVLSEPDKIHPELCTLEIPVALVDEVEKYVRLMNGVWLTSIKLRDLEIGKPEYTKQLLQLADDCHEIDSLGKYLQIETRRTTPNPEHSSAGVELGPAENWLHRLVILLEAMRIGDEVRRDGPLPLWKVMATDLCGTTISNPSELKKELGERFRIFTVGDNDAPNAGAVPPTTCGEEMNRKHIFPEFLMVGRLSKDGSGAVEWDALVGATISEPYQSCRIQLRFGNDDERIKIHADWFREKWNRGKPSTDQFLDLLTKEIESLRHESIPEAK